MIKMKLSVAVFRVRKDDHVGGVAGGHPSSLMRHDWRWGAPHPWAMTIRRNIARPTPRVTDDLLLAKPFAN